jgi:hypothetical protein
LIAIAIVLAGSVSALAQPSEADYSKLSRRVDEGDTVFVTTRTEGLIEGRLVRLAPEAIIVASEQGERTVAFSDVGWIEKRGDPVWNGGLIGAGILGFGMMGGAGASCSPDCATQVPQATAVGVAVGAAIGALVDWMIPGRTLLSGQRPRARPPSHSASPEGRTSLASLSNQVSPGDKISVHTIEGADTTGRFARASDASVTVDLGEALQDIPANKVTAVRRYRGGTHLKKALLIGIPLGALLGSGVCYKVDEPTLPSSQHDSGMPCGVGILLGAGGGAALGALIGGKTWGSTVVYTVAPTASLHSVGIVASLALF